MHVDTSGLEDTTPFVLVRDEDACRSSSVVGRCVPAVGRPCRNRLYRQSKLYANCIRIVALKIVDF